MNHVIDRLDKKVLGWTQRYADRAEKEVGASRFYQGVFLVFLSFAFLETYQVVHVRPKNNFVAIPFWAIPVAQYFCYILFLFAVVDYWKQYIRDGMRKSVFGNPMTEKYKEARVTLLLATLCTVLYFPFVDWMSGLLLLCSCALQMMGFYLLCTTPKPKSNSKLRLAWEKFKSRFADEPEPEPA